MNKIKLDNTKQTITWINNGEDIAQPFTIDVEVCVNHKWGGICEHTWKEISDILSELSKFRLKSTMISN